MKLCNISCYKSSKSVPDSERVALKIRKACHMIHTFSFNYLQKTQTVHTKKKKKVNSNVNLNRQPHKSLHSEKKLKFDNFLLKIQWFISITTGPILGLFVLISIHFSYRLQIGPWKFDFPKKKKVWKIAKPFSLDRRHPHIHIRLNCCNISSIDTKMQILTSKTTLNAIQSLYVKQSVKYVTQEKLAIIKKKKIKKK